ncbi:MAG: two component transcriptional regulator, LuxR family [Chthoniobacteraceae bacterium]|nr:two component transcriptional regulator, LuxR family [Chthoniobacteraceae bacterium]
MTQPIRVALVEDNPLLRRQLAQLLQNAPGFHCAGVFADAETALATLPSHPPDVVLMDIQLPQMSGVECVARLKAALPTVNVLILTVYDDSESIFQALENGANGYLLKRTPPAELLTAIEDVQRGGAPMSGHIARLVVQSFHRRGPSPRSSENLTPREEEVLRLVAQGFINKEIAERLTVGVETVRQHLKNIYAKLHVKGRTEAAMKFFG